MHTLVVVVDFEANNVTVVACVAVVCDFRVVGTTWNVRIVSVEQVGVQLVELDVQLVLQALHDKLVPERGVQRRRPWPFAFGVIRGSRVVLIEPLGLGRSTDPCLIKRGVVVVGVHDVERLVLHLVVSPGRIGGTQWRNGLRHPSHVDWVQVAVVQHFELVLVCVAVENVSDGIRRESFDDFGENVRLDWQSILVTCGNVSQDPHSLAVLL